MGRRVIRKQLKNYLTNEKIANFISGDDIEQSEI